MSNEETAGFFLASWFPASKAFAMKTSARWLVALLGLGPILRAAELPSAISPRWTEIAPGVWQTVIGRAEEFTLLGAADIAPNSRIHS